MGQIERIFENFLWKSRDILYLGGGILLVALALFFTYKSSMPEGK